MSNFSESDVLAAAGKVVAVVRAEVPPDQVGTAINILNAARAAILGAASNRLPSLSPQDACLSGEAS